MLARSVVQPASLLILLLQLGAPRALTTLVDSADRQSAALEQISAATPEETAAVTEADVLLALERGWFDAAKALLRLLRARGDAVATLADVRARATKMRDEATEVINLMRVGANAEATAVNCAFQWAQRPDFIYLNVKFSARIDGPVTVLNVDNEHVEMGNNTLLFEGIGRQKPKTFKLNLTFHDAILPEQSTWSFASVGRISFTIAKAKSETWPRLLEGKVKPKNMYTWYERQTALDAEVKKEAKEKKDEEKKEKAKADAAAGPSAPPPAGDSPPASLPPTPPLPKKGKSGESKKKKKPKEKDEV